MQPIPSLDDLNWSRIRALAKELAATGSADEIARIAEGELVAPDHKRRMLGVYLLGFTSAARPANLELLRASRPRSALGGAGGAGPGVRRLL